MREIAWWEDCYEREYVQTGKKDAETHGKQQKNARNKHSTCKRYFAMI